MRISLDEAKKVAKTSSSSLVQAIIKPWLPAQHPVHTNAELSKLQSCRLDMLPHICKDKPYYNEKHLSKC